MSAVGGVVLRVMYVLTLFNLQSLIYIIPQQINVGIDIRQKIKQPMDLLIQGHE